MMFAFCFQVPMWLACLLIGAQSLRFAAMQPFRVYHGIHIHIYPGRYMCLLVIVCGPHKECTEWLLLPLLWVGGASCYSFSCSQSFHPYVGACSFGDMAGSYPIPLPSIHGWGRVFFSTSVPANNTVNSKSVLSVKPGDSGVVLGIRLMNLFTSG